MEQATGCVKRRKEIEMGEMMEDSIQFEVGMLPQWQPIEMAPRDGTRILAFGGGLGEVAEVVNYNERVGCWNAPNDTLDDRDDEPDGYSRPTHWMPLPDPPKA